MQTKICPTCKIEKTIENYNKNQSRKDGFCRECRGCQSLSGKKHYHTKKSPKLKENLKKDHKICKGCNQELPLSDFKPGNGRFNVGSKCKPCFNKNWNEYQKQTSQNKKYNKYRKQTDPQFKLKTLLRGRLLDALKRHTKGGKVNKTHSAIILIGCTIDEYKTYLEKQFKPDMSWDNHGVVWEIDHIIPCSKFDLTNPIQQSKCFNYKNTQPLYKSENRSKGNR
jgi:hypothetical protein